MICITAALLAGVTVTLPMEAEVGGTEMTLGQLASVSGEDPAQVARVEAVHLGYVPAPGYSRLLRDYQITWAIERVAPDLEVRLVGQDAVRVRPAVEILGAAAIGEAARLEMQRLVGTQDAVASMDALGSLVRVPRGSLPAELRVRPSAKPLAAGSMSIPVEVWVDGTLYTTVWTRWQVERWETALVLARAVRAGEPFSPGQFVRQRVRRAASNGQPGLSLEQLDGAVAARDLAAGAVVGVHDVHRPQVIRIKDALFVQVKKGGVTARVPCVARESGAVGDRIRVETLDGSRELRAMIVNRDLVEIDLGD